MNKFANFQKENHLFTKLKAKYKGNHYETYKVEIKDKNGVSLEEANKYVISILEKAKSMNPNNRFQLLYFMNDKWFSTNGFKTEWGDIEPPFSHYGLKGVEMGNVMKIRINKIKMPSVTGGSGDIHNDCLFNAVKYALADKSESILPKYPSNFKKWVKIGVNEPIDYRDIPKIEQKIKTRICVAGDYTYDSPFAYVRTVHVELKDGHYKFRNNMAVRKHLVKYKPTDKKFVYFELKDGFIRTYDGLELYDDYDLTAKELGCSSKCTYKQNPKGDIVENYEQFMKDAIHLENLTGIQLSDHQFNVKDCALAEFYKFAKIYEFEEVDDEETRWLDATKNCGLMYCDPCDGEMNVFDVNSFYPSIMSDQSTLLPCSKPIYQEIVEKPEFGWIYGIYRAKISGNDKCLFMSNSKHHYTHLEMKRAEELGYDIELILDGRPNFANYKKRINANHLFKAYIDGFYPHKAKINLLTGKTNKLIKEMMNCLWGALGQRTKEFRNDEEGEIETDHPDNIYIYPRHGEKMIIKTIKGFKRPFARIGPFITSTGRVRMSRIVEPYRDEVYRVHTDGFYTTADDVSNIGAGLGQLKLEKTGEYEINSLNDIIAKKN